MIAVSYIWLFLRTKLSINNWTGLISDPIVMRAAMWVLSYLALDSFSLFKDIVVNLSSAENDLLNLARLIHLIGELLWDDVSESSTQFELLEFACCLLGVLHIWIYWRNEEDWEKINNRKRRLVGGWSLIDWLLGSFVEVFTLVYRSNFLEQKATRGFLKGLLSYLRSAWK